MLDTASRTLRLIALLHQRRLWSGADLADALGVTARCVRRDVERARALGYPVHASAGVGGGYSLGAGRELPPLPLDDQEAMAVAVGLRSAISGPICGLEDAALRALTKLEAVLPRRLRRRLNTLEAVSVRLPGQARRIDAQVLATLASASRAEVGVRLEYRDRADVVSQRRLEPYRLVHTSTRWYLLAWDLKRLDWRTFRVDRVTPGTVVLGPRFSPRPLPADDIARYVTHAVSAAPHTIEARAEIAAAAADVERTMDGWLGVVEPIDESRCVLIVGGDDVDTIALCLGFLGFEFTVISPPELTEACRQLGQRLARAGQ